jgi:hypothetical protein
VLCTVDQMPSREVVERDKYRQGGSR